MFGKMKKNYYNHSNACLKRHKFFYITHLCEMKQNGKFNFFQFFQKKEITPTNAAFWTKAQSLFLLLFVQLHMQVQPSKSCTLVRKCAQNQTKISILCTNQAFKLAKKEKKTMSIFKQIQFQGFFLLKLCQ